jgi:hypothetical protein
MTGTVRLARLRSLDTEATRGPWRVRDIDVVSDEGGYDVAATVQSSVRQARANAALIVVMRNAWPAVLEVVAIVLAVHVPNEDYQQSICRGCARLGRWPCGQYLAARSVLDTLGDPP